MEKCGRGACDNLDAQAHHAASHRFGQLNMFTCTRPSQRGLQAELEVLREQIRAMDAALLQQDSDGEGDPEPPRPSTSAPSTSVKSAGRQRAAASDKPKWSTTGQPAASTRRSSIDSNGSQPGAGLSRVPLAFGSTVPRAAYGVGGVLPRAGGGKAESSIATGAAAGPPLLVQRPAGPLAASSTGPLLPRHRVSENNNATALSISAPLVQLDMGGSGRGTLAKQRTIRQSWSGGLGGNGGGGGKAAGGSSRAIQLPDLPLPGFLPLRTSLSGAESLALTKAGSAGSTAGGSAGGRRSLPPAWQRASAPGFMPPKPPPAPRPESPLMGSPKGGCVSVHAIPSKGMCAGTCASALARELHDGHDAPCGGGESCMQQARWVPGLHMPHGVTGACYRLRAVSASTPLAHGRALACAYTAPSLHLRACGLVSCGAASLPQRRRRPGGAEPRAAQAGHAGQNAGGRAPRPRHLRGGAAAGRAPQAPDQGRLRVGWGRWGRGLGDGGVCGAAGHVREARKQANTRLAGLLQHRRCLR